MVYAIKDARRVSRKEIDEAFKDLGLGEPDSDKRIPGFYLADSYQTKSFSTGSLRFATPREIPKIPAPGRLRTYRGTDEQKYPYKKGREDETRLRVASLGKLDEAEIGEQLNEICEISEEERGGESFLAMARDAGAIKPAFRDFEKNIEEIVKEKWRYLVMQFGGVFLTEIRPSKIFMGHKTLADELIVYDEREKKYHLDSEKLGNYLRANSKGVVQVHFGDIILNPKTKNYELFSITSGDVKKANIFLELANFLSVYNKGKETVIPVHLPYYEKWVYKGKEYRFGSLDEDGEREALFKAENALKYLREKWPKGVKLALETGNGLVEKSSEMAYGLLYDPFYFQTLTKGRKDFVSICEDVGHLNLENARTDWKAYLTEEISEFHVSGNNGKEDLHTVATPQTLRSYSEIMSFLKFYSGNICAEVGRGQLTADEFVKGVKNLAYVLFSEPTKHDSENLKKIEQYVRVTCIGELNGRNLNKERYEKYLTIQASS